MSETLVTWLELARGYIGLAEIPGKDTHPIISRWLIGLKAWWSDDETPWCGTFVAACMRDVGVSLPRHWYRAKGWLDWGVAISSPAVGCVVVYERKGGGHVGLIVGKDRAGNLMTLGGNQGNRVSILPFDPARVLGFRWPSQPTPITGPLPLVDSDGAMSTHEG